MDDPDNTPRPGGTIDELDALVADPQRWGAIDPDKLRHLLFYQCLAYGIHPDDRAIPTVMGLHRVAVERLHPEVRRDVVTRLARAVERVHREHGLREGAGCTNALLPFLLEDPDPSVVSSAAREMALLLPLEQDDPLTGPRYVRSLVEHARSDDARAGIIGGLLELGDERLGALVAAGWSPLAEDGRQTLALLIQGFRALHRLTVEFLVSWLEDEARQPLGRSFGVVAATLARAGRHAAEHGIADVRRVFPVTDAREDEPFAVTREWTLKRYAAGLQERLLQVARAEDPPVLMPHVLSYWGLAEAGYRLAVAAAARTARAAARGIEGPCDPVRVELVPDWPEDPEVETLLEWGILNPFGPTVNTLRLTPADEASALVHTVYHPRSTASHVVAILPRQPDRARVATAVEAVMRRNGDAGFWRMRSLPDYVHRPEASTLSAGDAARAIELARASALASGDEAVDLREHAIRLAVLAADPWSTLAREIDAARSASAGTEPAAEGTRSEGAVDTGSTYALWLATAGAPAHVSAIRREIPVAWQRAQQAAEQGEPKE